MTYFEVSDFRLVSAFGKYFESDFYEVVQTAHKNILLAEQVGFSFFFESGLDSACAE